MRSAQTCEQRTKTEIYSDEFCTVYGSTEEHVKHTFKVIVTVTSVVAFCSMSLLALAVGKMFNILILMMEEWICVFWVLTNNDGIYKKKRTTVSSYYCVSSFRGIYILTREWCARKKFRLVFVFRWQCICDHKFVCFDRKFVFVRGKKEITSNTNQITAGLVIFHDLFFFYFQNSADSEIIYNTKN